MKRTHEIPGERWFEYFERLSKRLQGKPVRVERLEPLGGDQVESEALPLIGIELERKGSERGAVDISVGRPGTDVGHRVHRPTRLFERRGPGGELELACLDIEDEDGSKTLVYFEPSVSLDRPLHTGAAASTPQHP